MNDEVNWPHRTLPQFVSIISVHNIYEYVSVDDFDYALLHTVQLD